MANTSDNGDIPLPDRGTESHSRRQIMDYFHASSPRGLGRMFASREKVIDGIKTFAWVAPITLLIWVYAEREQVVTPNSPNVSSVSVKLENNDPTRSVEFQGNSEPTVNLQLTGPQQAFEHVKELLTMRIPRETLPINVGNLAVGNNQSVNVMNGIRDLDIFKSNGVTVEDCQPPALRVNVYKMGECEVPVRTLPSATNVSPDSTFEPARVQIKGPAELVNEVKAGYINMYADLSGLDVLKQPGSHRVVSVPLVLDPPEPKLAISRPQVSATIVVMASDVEYEIPDPVQIYYMILSTEQSIFQVTLAADSSATVDHLHVSGPASAIQSIKDKTFPGGVKALLNIETNDPSKDSITRTLTFQLPPGVHVSDQDRDRSVKFTVTRRE